MTTAAPVGLVNSCGMPDCRDFTPLGDGDHWHGFTPESRAAYHAWAETFRQAVQDWHEQSIAAQARAGFNLRKVERIGVCPWCLTGEHASCGQPEVCGCARRRRKSWDADNDQAET
jgi:hypothetical protein